MKRGRPKVTYCVYDLMLKKELGPLTIDEIHSLTKLGKGSISNYIKSGKNISKRYQVIPDSKEYMSDYKEDEYYKVKMLDEHMDYAYELKKNEKKSRTMLGYYYVDGKLTFGKVVGK